jgi:hypothetical protein
MKLKILGIFILTILTAGCVSEYNAKLPSNAAQILIVEGNIIENTNAMFYLSKSFPIDSVYNWNENLYANITLIGDNGYQSSPAINTGNGAYMIPIGNLDENVSYGIQIEYDGDIYQSALAKPLYTPEIDSVSWVQPEKAGTVFFRVSTHDDTNRAKFFIWDYTENWEVRAEYYTTIFFNPVDNTFYNDYTAPNYFCWKSAASNQFLIGSTESLSENKIINKQFDTFESSDSRFSTLYCITVNQRAISKEAYEYYQNKITLNEGMGGLFTPQPSELAGNITCITDPSKKVMGFVEVTKNTTLKRKFVSSYEISRPIIYSTCELITKDSINTLMSEYGLTYADIYRMYSPAGAQDPMAYPRLLPESWSYSRCTDCVANGGSKNKPDFWPNDDK